MILFCRSCGNKQTFGASAVDYTCSNCNSKMVKLQHKKILVACSQCKLGQSITFDHFHDWDCRSCGSTNPHPATVHVVGNGNKYTEPHRKTTINIESRVLESLDKHLQEINKDRDYKIKRGAYLRLLIKKELGLKC